jgi:large subunit ribosomal protein L6
MSRVGNKPVPVTSGVKVAVSGQKINVEGPLGKLAFEFRPQISVAVEGDKVVVKRADDERESRALHGLTRSLIENMIEGVSKGFEKRLEIVGVGYLAAIKGDTLQLRVVGQFAAEVRAARKPEPYKGKGVRYQGEQVKIKPGKSATK